MQLIKLNATDSTNNYLKQFITDRLPTVTEDAAVFDLAEAKKAKAQKFLQDNKLT